MNLLHIALSSFRSVAKPVFFTLGLWMAVITASFGAEPRGLVIHVEPPATYVEVLEYSSLVRRDGYSTDFVAAANGGRRQLKNTAIQAVVPYPGSKTAPGGEVASATVLSQITLLRRQVPVAEAKLTLAWQKWKVVEQQAQQRQAQPTLKLTQPGTPSSLQLVVGERTYPEAVLTGVDEQFVSISYADGVARIPLETLQPAQITALNQTTTTCRIDPDWRSKRAAMLEKPVPAEGMQSEQTPPRMAEQQASVIPGEAEPVPMLPATAGRATPVPRPAQMAGLSELEQAVANEEFGTPPEPVAVREPSVTATIEFINAKLAAQDGEGVRNFRFGYVKSINLWVFRGTLNGRPDHAVTFSVADLNPSKIVLNTDRHRSPFSRRMVEDFSVNTRCVNDARKIELFWFNGSTHSTQKSSTVGIPCKDKFDMEKIARALENLILAYGGKAEAF